MSTQDQTADHEAGPVIHYINFKTRAVLMCRGENAQADAESRGFKKVSAAHFVKFIDKAQNGFRKKGKKNA